MSARGLVWVVAGMACIAPLRAQLPVTTGLSVSLADHRVTAGAGLERSSGTMFGLWATTSLPWQSVEARASLRAGSLGAAESAGFDRDVGEITLGASIPVSAWIGLDAGVVVRRYESALAAQRWVWGEVGLHGRHAMLDDA